MTDPRRNNVSGSQFSPMLPAHSDDSGDIRGLVAQGAGATWGPTSAVSWAGTDKADQFSGKASDDTLDGRGASDRLSGLGGDDVLIGGIGHDRLDGGLGDDTMIGGAGNDFLTDSDGRGNDQLSGGAGNDSLDAGDGYNSAEGGSGNDSIHGGRDRDVIVGGTGQDTMLGGAGDDVYVLRAGDGGTASKPDIIGEAQGNDTIHIQGLDPADVKLTESPAGYGALRLALKGAGGGFTYADCGTWVAEDVLYERLLSGPEGIERVVFDNGVAWDLTKGLPKPGNHAPRASDDTYKTVAAQTITVDAAHGVLANDRDADRDRMSVVLLDGPTNGFLTLNADGSFSYQPGGDRTGPFIGEDSFRYVVTDGWLSDTGQVKITVSEPPARRAGDVHVEVGDMGRQAQPVAHPEDFLFV